MAIKINVSKEDQESINRVMLANGYASQKRKFHCTVGFIEKLIPEEESDSFGKTITQELQKLVDTLLPKYEVEKVSHLFGHVIAFEPTVQSRLHLKEINEWLFNQVIKLSEGRWGLNDETQPAFFTPHMTLWHTRKVDGRLKNLSLIAESHPTYQLYQAGYVLF